MNSDRVKKLKSFKWSTRKFKMGTIFSSDETSAIVPPPPQDDGYIFQDGNNYIFQDGNNYIFN